MSPEENVKVVRSAYQAFRSGDIAALLEFLTEDVVWIQPGPPDTIPSAGRRVGRQGVADYFESIARSFDIEGFEVREILAEGETVVVLGAYRRRVRATGKLDVSDWVHHFTMRGGLIARHQGFADTASTLAAMADG